MEILWFIIVGLIAGWLAGQLVGGGGFGVIGDIIIGIIGAVTCLARPALAREAV